MGQETANEDQIMTSLISDIKQHFPEVTHDINKVVRDFWCGDTEMEKQSYWLKLETFFDLTNAAIQAKNKRLAQQYLTFISQRLSSACQIEDSYIDTYYVIFLMWNIKDKAIFEWGWALIPDNLKQIYTGMWGNIRYFNNQETFTLV